MRPWQILYDSESLLAIASGLALALAFPLPGWSLLAWFALAPLFWVLHEQRPGAAFQLGWTAGFAFHIASLYWIVHTVGTYTPLTHVGGLAVLFLLAATLALALALFAAATALAARRGVPVGLFAPLWWVAIEWMRARIGGLGFPWLLLGYSQAPHLSLVQSAELAGPYLLSALIVLSNVALAQLLQPAIPQRTRATLLWLAAFLLFCAQEGGNWRLANLHAGKREPAPLLRAAVIQGNIPQDRKWDRDYQQATIDIYDRLSRDAARPGLDLIVWPETAVPFYFETGGSLRERVAAVARDTRAWLLVGSPAVEHDPADRARYFNRVYLIGPDGAIAGHYDKRILVPFGEYVPMQSVLFFVDRIVEGAGGFASGGRQAPLRFGPHAAGVQICYEAIYPALAREQAAAGASLLVNVTNDAWFGDTSAPWQHLAMASFRAVENRRPLLRAANTGISALVEIDGTVVGPTDLFTHGYRVYRLQRPVHTTFYSRHGDLFAAGCALVSSVLLLACLRRRG